MTIARKGLPGVATARIAVAASVAIFSTTVAFGDSFPSSSAVITVESVGPSVVLAHADGAWVLYAPTLSVDCSPPRGCYATTQRIHYDFSCAPRYAVMTERISMDLNGAVVKHEVMDATMRYSPSWDAGAARLLDTFCPLPIRD